MIMMTPLKVMAGLIGILTMKQSYINHRSLLVVNRRIRLGFHYDSLNQRNVEVAKKTLGKISDLLNEGYTFIDASH
jgi:hypothetical protein